MLCSFKCYSEKLLIRTCVAVKDFSVPSDLKFYYYFKCQKILSRIWVAKDSVISSSTTSSHLLRFLGLCNNFGYVVMLSAAHDILRKQESGNSTVTVKTSLICSHNC